MSLALSTALWAESPEKKGLDVINRSTAEAHIGFLADDDLEGREAGFRGGRIAGDYIVANLKSLGIDPVGDSYYHPFEAYHMERQKRGARWQVQPDSIAAIKQTGVFQKLSLNNILGKIEGKNPNEIVIVGAASNVQSSLLCTADQNAARWFPSKTRVPSRTHWFCSQDASSPASVP